jgi:hypothetical protein
MNNWSPEANRAHDEAAIRWRIRQQQIEHHKRGAYYDEATQTLRVPSCIYNPTITPRAAAAWKGEGLRWDPAQREWYTKVNPEDADERLKKVRQLFDELWGTSTAKQTCSEGEIESL